MRELWDTVVLRDILGYISPGCVTLFALIVLTRRVDLPFVQNLVNAAATQLDLSPPRESEWLTWQPWLAAGVVAAASYVVGHLQAGLLELLEKVIPSWNLGELALAYLERDDPGDWCARAALAKFQSIPDGACLHPLVVYLRRRRQDREEECREKLDRLCKDQRPGQERREREKEAEDLWRLCDRYVLHKDRDIHSMFMGRYYVLAVLFSNLGMSAILLGIAVLVAHFRKDGVVVLTTAVLVGGIVAAWLVERLSPRCGSSIRHWSVIASNASVAGLAAICCLLSLLLSPIRGVTLIPVAAGVLMMLASARFRARFIECTFPIFYAIVQAEEKSEAGQA